MPVAPQLCKRTDPNFNNQTCSLTATLKCCTFASLAVSFSSTVPRAASASLGTSSAPFFYVLPMSSDACPRAGILESRPWIIIDQYSPFCRFASDSIGPRASFRKEPGRFARGMLWTTGPGPSRGLASAPGLRAWAIQFCPFIVKTGDFFF